MDARHTFPLLARAEQAATSRWPQTTSRLRWIVSNFARYGHPHVQRAFVLASEGETEKAAEKISEVLLKLATADSSSFKIVVDDVVEVLDLIATKDLVSAERVRPLLRQALISWNASPGSTSAPGPLKLGYISNSPLPSPAANCVHILKMCSALRRGGVDVTLYAEGGLDDSPAAREALFHEFDIATRFNYIRVEHGTHSIETSIKKALAAVTNSSTHLITRSPKAAYFAAVMGIETLLELHAPPQSSLRYVRDLSRLAEFRGLIVITNALREEIIRCLPELTDRTWVVPDAADAPKSDGQIFELRHIAQANFHVGYVGHLYSGKGLELIIDIAARLPDVAFHILGGDPDDIRRWEKHGAGRSNIVFYGHRPHAEVPAFLRSVDVAIAPYQRKVFARGNTVDIGRWMSPLKLFEYMANAKPIVSSDVAVLREVLKEGQTALLVDPDNVDAWVSALDRLRADAELRESLGRAARSDFEERFTWSKRAERVLELLLAKKKSAAQTLNTVSDRDTKDTETKPSICWLYEDKLVDWAYGINSQRIASRLQGFTHVLGDSRAGRCDKIDLKLCFDILIHIKHRTNVPGLSIVRIGGPKPLMQISGGDSRLLERAFSDVAAIIVLSPELEGFAADFHPNIFLIPNGLDLGFWHPKLLSRRTRPFRAGFAASLKTRSQREVKGLTIAAAACEEAGVELLAVGRGANHIPHERMLTDFYSEIDVLVHPVGPGKEGSSNVIMECLALGIPVITTVHAGYHAARLRDHMEAIFCERNTAAFAAALNELKQDQDLRTRLSSEGRAFAERHHDLVSIAEKYEGVFRFVLGRSEARSFRDVASSGKAHSI